LKGFSFTTLYNPLNYTKSFIAFHRAAPETPIGTILIYLSASDIYLDGEVYKMTRH